MQLAGLAVEPEAAEVVNPVGDVGGLLYLGYERARAYAVYSSGGEEEHVAGGYAVVAEHVGNGVAFHAGGVFLRGDFAAETRHEVRAPVGSHHVPHLGLAL